jgi:hypothetical protein
LVSTTSWFRVLKRWEKEKQENQNQSPYANDFFKEMDILKRALPYSGLTQQGEKIKPYKII